MNIIEIINQIEEDKRRNKEVPIHAITKEVKSIAIIKYGHTSEEVDKELERLKSKNKIYMGNTINDKYIIVL